MPERLARAFYARSPVVVARELLGQRLVRVREGRRLAGRIVEAEAYAGAGDAASHAHRGRTERNAPMFGPPGHAYVYFIYGMHWMFNVVAYQEEPGAVLIRALVPLEGVERIRLHRQGKPDRLLTSGPGRLTQALQIDRALNGADLCHDPRIFIECDRPVPDAQVAQGPRVGVSGDESARQRAWRFFIKENKSRHQ